MWNKNRVEAQAKADISQWSRGIQDDRVGHWEVHENMAVAYDTKGDFLWSQNVYDPVNWILPLTLLVPLGLLMYIRLLLEAYRSTTYQFITNTYKSDDVLTRVNRGRRTVPRVQFRVKCWHSGNPNAGKNNKNISYERFVDVPVLRCVDASGPITPDMFQYGRVITRVNVMHISPHRLKHKPNILNVLNIM